MPISRTRGIGSGSETNSQWWLHIARRDGPDVSTENSVANFLTWGLCGNSEQREQGCGDTFQALFFPIMSFPTMPQNAGSSRNSKDQIPIIPLDAGINKNIHQQRCYLFSRHLRLPDKRCLSCPSNCRAVKIHGHKPRFLYIGPRLIPAIG